MCPAGKWGGERINIYIYIDFPVGETRHEEPKKIYIKNSLDPRNGLRGHYASRVVNSAPLTYILILLLDLRPYGESCFGAFLARIFPLTPPPPKKYIYIFIQLFPPVDFAPGGR